MYLATLKALASGVEMQWGQIRSATRALLGHPSNDKTFNKTLNVLIDAAYVFEVASGNKREATRYKIVDPIVAYAVSRMRV